jgi:hypothetical protein
MQDTVVVGKHHLSERYPYCYYPGYNFDDVILSDEKTASNEVIFFPYHRHHRSQQTKLLPVLGVVLTNDILTSISCENPIQETQSIYIEHYNTDGLLLTQSNCRGCIVHVKEINFGNYNI